MKFLDKTGLDTLWAKIKSTFQTLGNLVTSWSGTPSDTKYPSEKLVKTSLDAKADANKVVAIADATISAAATQQDKWYKIATLKNSVTGTATNILGSWNITFNRSAYVNNVKLCFCIRIESNGVQFMQCKAFTNDESIIGDFIIKVVTRGASGNVSAEIWISSSRNSGYYGVMASEFTSGNYLSGSKVKSLWNYTSYTNPSQGTTEPVTDVATNVIATTAEYVVEQHANAIPDIYDGAWVGVKPGAPNNQDACYWKVCSFNVGNYWSLDFRVSATNRNFDSNVYEDKVISLKGYSSSQVGDAREIRLCYNKIYSDRGYGNIFYYTLIEGVVTVYIYTACKPNVTQFLRLDSVTTKSSITNLTWYSDTTPPTQPSNPVKFTESFQAMKVTTATTTKTYLAGVNSTGYASGSQTSLLTDTGIYATTNPGELNATQFKINEHCTVTYNDARASVDFTFS